MILGYCRHKSWAHLWVAGGYSYTRLSCNRPAGSSALRGAVLAGARRLGPGWLREPVGSLFPLLHRVTPLTVAAVRGDKNTIYIYICGFPFSPPLPCVLLCVVDMVCHVCTQSWHWVGGGAAGGQKCMHMLFES